MDRRNFLKLAGSILPALALEPARVVGHVVQSRQARVGTIVECEDWSDGYYIGNPAWECFDYTCASYNPYRLDNFGIQSASIRNRIVELSETFDQCADRVELFKIAVMEEATRQIK